MANIILKLFVVLSLFASLNSLQVVNIEELPSDFFQEQFFKELPFISKTAGIIEPDDINGQKCILELQEIVKKLKSMSMEVLPFIDSWGRLPSGLLYGHLTDYGNYDQCVKTTVTLNETLGTTTGQYCLASIPLTSSSKSFEKEVHLVRELAMEERLSLDMKSITIKFGVCVPDSCSPEVTTKIFQNVLKTISRGTFSNIAVSGCSVGKKPDFEAIDIFAIVVFSSIGFLMVLSTLYDFYTTQMEKRPIPILMAFSIITNGRKMFMINNKTSANSIDCLTGIRVLSMIWVMYAHTYAAYALLNVTNTLDVLDWIKSFWSLRLLMGTVSVDSFFLLSGLLIAWLGLQELDRTNGRLNVLMMYVHRYIRLTPPVAAVILFFVSLNKYMGSGPMWNAILAINDGCKEKWWVNLLFVQNYVPIGDPDKMCVGQTWYLAADTQLYVLSPLVLISLWKWGKKCIPVIFGLCLLSIGCVVSTFIAQGYNDFIGTMGEKQSEKTYIPTHTRFSPWLVGICTGYFMHINKKRILRPPKVIQIIGWIVSIGTFLCIIFAPYSTTQTSLQTSVGEAAAYESLKRVSWSIALAWIVVACHHGYGGIVNSILSHPIWQPFGRLTYCMYLVHMAVIAINLGTVRTDLYFSDFRLTLDFWSTFGMTLIVAVTLSLSFEAPVLVIEKAIFGKRKPKSELNQTILPSASSETPLHQEHKEVSQHV